MSHFEQTHGQVISWLITNVCCLETYLKLSNSLDFEQTRTNILYASKLDIIVLKWKFKLLQQRLLRNKPAQVETAFLGKIKGIKQKTKFWDALDHQEAFR